MVLPDHQRSISETTSPIHPIFSSFSSYYFTDSTNVLYLSAPKPVFSRASIHSITVKERPFFNESNILAPCCIYYSFFLCISFVLEHQMARKQNSIMRNVPKWDKTFLDLRVISLIFNKPENISNTVLLRLICTKTILFHSSSIPVGTLCLEA